MTGIRFSHGVTRNALTACMLLVTSFQTAMHSASIIGVFLLPIQHPALLTARKLLTAFLVLLGLAASWYFLMRSNRETRDSGFAGMGLLWLLSALAVTQSPLTGKGAALFVFGG